VELNESVLTVNWSVVYQGVDCKTVSSICQTRKQ